MDMFMLSNLGPVTDGVTEEHWSPEELRSEIFKSVSLFASKDVKPGDRVMILHGNNIHFVADLFGVWMLGACAVCVDSGIGRAEYQKLLDLCKIRAVIFKGDFPEKLEELRGLANLVDSEERQEHREDTSVPIFPPHSLDSEALILYTSGSTGDPKGVVHTFRTLQTKWFALESYVPLDNCENTLCLLPTHFGHGLICNCLYPLVHGKHLVFYPKFDMVILSKLDRILERHKITFMSSVPALWKLVLMTCKPPPSNSLREVHIGSAPLSKELWSQVQEWTQIKRVWNTYGITETGSWVAGTSRDEVEPETGLIGIGWDCEIRVSPIDNEGASTQPFSNEPPVCPQGEKGYVWLSTPCTMKEYLDREDLTRQVIFGSWFFTGDIGYIDAKGQLFLVGRVRNEINKGGIKISAEEIDLILEKHPAIFEACSFSVEDPVLGENVGVALVFNSGIDRFPTLNELMEWTSTMLSDYKVPAIWYCVGEIPKTSRGKIKRTDVAAACAGLEAMQ